MEPPRGLGPSVRLAFAAAPEQAGSEVWVSLACQTDGATWAAEAGAATFLGVPPSSPYSGELPEFPR